MLPMAEDVLMLIQKDAESRFSVRSQSRLQILIPFGLKILPLVHNDCIKFRLFLIRYLQEFRREEKMPEIVVLVFLCFPPIRIAGFDQAFRKTRKRTYENGRVLSERRSDFARDTLVVKEKQDGLAAGLELFRKLLC